MSTLPLCDRPAGYNFRPTSDNVYIRVKEDDVPEDEDFGLRSTASIGDDAATAPSSAQVRRVGADRDTHPAVLAVSA